MKIQNMLLTAGLAGYYFDDLEAIKRGAKRDGFFYTGKPLTPGFSRIRQPSETISVMLVMEDGQVGIGDCIAVQYSGVGGRDPVLVAEKHIPLLEDIGRKYLIGYDVKNFVEFSQFVDFLEKNGERLHSAIRYGLSQAGLDAVAKMKGITMAEVISEEYHLTVSKETIPIYAQSGDDRYTGAEKMILKKAQVLPHGLFNSVEKIGKEGEKLIDYLQWLNKRIREFSTPSYMPVIHFDVYGTIGDIFNNDLEKITQYLAGVAKAAKPFRIRVESPLFKDSKEEIIKTLGTLKELLSSRGVDVEIVADEYCNTLEDIRDFVDGNAVHMIQIKTPDLGAIHNTIEAVLYCKKYNVQAYLGGTCTSTDVAGRIAAHIALATQPEQVIARPGMGVDEGMQIVYNEMKRTLALVQNRT